MRGATWIGGPAGVAVVLGLVGCQSSLTEPTDDVEMAKTEVTALAPGPFPVPSHWIAFLGSYQLRMIRDNGANLTQIYQWSVPPEPISAAWSPAGPNRIAIGLMWDYSDSMIVHVGVVNTNGSGLQDLTPAGVKYANGLAWSPDGNKIAFNADGRLMVVNADGTGLDTIAANPKLSRPAWSPDGQKIAYFAGVDVVWPVNNQRGFWTVNPDGTGRVKIRDLPPPINSSDNYDGLQYSPDGTQLAMCHGGTLEVMNANGTGLLSLLLGCQAYYHYSGSDGPQWSPNGSRILTVHNYNLHTIAPDGTSPLQLTFGGTVLKPNEQGRWSRQGNQIAFVRKGIPNPNDNTVDAALYDMAANGANQQKLTGFGMEVRFPTWGP